MATNNNFTVTGIVAMDAQVKNNGNGSVWAKFPLAIRTTKKDKDGNEKKISALQDIEVGTKEGSPKALQAGFLSRRSSSSPIL